MLWKNIPTNCEKMVESVAIFKNYMRKKLLKLQNEHCISESNCPKVVTKSCDQTPQRCSLKRLS